MPFSINHFFLYSITQQNPFLSFLCFSLFQKSAPSFCQSFQPNIFCRRKKGTDLSLLASAMEDDWDLHAVVRGCCNTTTTSSSTTTSTTTNSGSGGGGGGGGGGGSSFRSDFGSNQQLCFPASASPAFGIEQTSSNNHPPLFSLPDPFESRNNNGIIGDLNELYKPFFPKSQSIFAPTQSTPLQISTSVSSFTISKNPTSHQLKQQQQPHQQLKKSVVTSSSANSQTPRSKRRKNQLKKICQVPAEALSSDVWAWRKYGQKPIKGSPYPRGYYRCSSSKGCLARKQVERNRSDPVMFIVTYTAEHNHPAPTHRNSLAGSTRQKSLTPQSATGDDSNDPSPPKPTCSSPATSLEDELLAQSTNAESKEEDKDLMEDENEVELGDLSEMEVTDDFFAGLEGLAGDPVTGECFSDNFPANFGLPWHANNAATAAGSL